MWCSAFQALHVMDALVHNSFISWVRLSSLFSLVHFIHFPAMLPFLALSPSLSIQPASPSLSVAATTTRSPSLPHHYHLHLTHYLSLSICPFLWNKIWIHYSFIQTYLSSPCAAPCPLSAKLFLIVLRLFTTHTAPSENTTTLGSIF